MALEIRGDSSIVSLASVSLPLIVSLPQDHIINRQNASNTNGQHPPNAH